MNILLLGSGGREHALAWKISQSPKLGKLYIAPGNAGTAEVGENLDVEAKDFAALKQCLIEKSINMVVVGPEDPLVAGVHDFIAADADISHIPVIGPKKEGAILEGSKDFSKAFMIRHGIPTAAYLSVTKENIADGKQFLAGLKPPYVLKADGLAAGKGVLILDSLQDAEAELELMLEGKFGEASKTVVIEEYLNGIELSVFALTDGISYKMLPSAKDYKRIGEADTGLNTGGMGAVSPVPFADDNFIRKVEELVVKPTVEGLKKDGIDYQGFIFFGLMNDNGQPKVIEYNVRMGDPETEVVIPRITSDILDLFEGVAQRNISERNYQIDPRTCLTVMLVSGGYPGRYATGKAISGLGSAQGSMVFHAGTVNRCGVINTNGGRVIAVSSFGDTIAEAAALSQENAKLISFEGKYLRTDIGNDLLCYGN
jgi:phosphoribosylamine---glycine ligase